MIENISDFKETKKRIKSVNMLTLGKTKKKLAETKEDEFENNYILKTLMETKNEWEHVSNLFSSAYEEELVDYCTYKLMALEVKYKYYLQKAKEKKLHA